MPLRPNALIIGAAKSGTTSLHNYLASHPAVFGSEAKELMYFTTFFMRGNEWYQSNFPEQEGVNVYFESTPQYTFRDKFPETAKRIRNYNPDMKLIFTVRHPVERIISHFNHWKRRYPERYSDFESMAKDPEEWNFFLNRTRYFYQIEAFRAQFPDDQIHIVFLEEIQNDFRTSLNAIFRFLGVAERADDIEHKSFNVGARRPTGERFGDEMSLASSTCICKELAEDVQAFLTYAGKPGDYWGPEFQ